VIKNIALELLVIIFIFLLTLASTATRISLILFFLDYPASKRIKLLQDQYLLLCESSNRFTGVGGCFWMLAQLGQICTDVKQGTCGWNLFLRRANEAATSVQRWINLRVSNHFFFILEGDLFRWIILIILWLPILCLKFLFCRFMQHFFRIGTILEKSASVF